MAQKPQPKRNIFFALIPYILLLGGIGIVIAIVVNYINQPVSWNDETTLATKLEDYPIYTAYVKEGDNTTIINGTFYDAGHPKKYTARVSTYDYNNPLTKTEWSDVNGDGVQQADEISTVLVRDSWHNLLQRAIDKWNASHPDKKGKIVNQDYYYVSFWDAWGPTLISTGFTVILVLFFVSRLSRSVAGSNNQAFNFNKSRARREEKSKIRFADVAGCDEEKAEMVELVEYLKNPKKFSRLGAKLPKGVLLVGHPGTGKTLLAKAVAGEANVPFYSISGSDFVEMFVGVGAGRVRDMFRVAKQNAPCVVFIDEIDAVGRQRGAGLGGGNDEREQTLNQLLVEMDGFEDNAGILVIAATNRDDVLDPALLRAGRFDRKITVSLPDKVGRAAIFRIHSRNKKVDPDVDFDSLAKRTVGFSGADIENVMNEAAILAVRANRESVSIKDIDEAIDRRIAGPAKSSRSLSPIERKRIAYHEAGHAIIGIKLPSADKVQKITIVPRGNTGGHVLMNPEDDRFLLTKEELEARIVGYLGGRSSEEIFFNEITTGAHNDIEVATRIARLMVTEYGMSDLGPIQYERDSGSVFLGRDYTSTSKNFSTQVAFEIDKEVRRIIDEAHDKAKAIITENKDSVVKIAEYLLEYETITADEISLVLEGRNPREEARLAEESKKAAAEEAKKVAEEAAKEEDSKAEETPEVKE